MPSCARPAPAPAVPAPWRRPTSPDALIPVYEQAGRLLRALHDAAAGFRPPPDAVWCPWPFRAGFGAPGTVISHCDAGPWHFAVRDGLPFALIDWDTAGPTGRLDEEAVKAQVTPDSADPAPLWALAWRARSAAWMVRHRALLENAITG